MATPRSSLTSAVLLMLAAVLLFALMDAGLKLLSSQYPPLQVAALRGLSSLPLVTLWVLATVPA
ncbi:MAG: EamA/RhaT family transporter, partial [Pseudoxanthomonas sp.]|nr:EamA/RhaT family transporter [Pseudoxanthomonas sp.]